MEYVKSSLEDRHLHQKYHAQNLSGYDVGDTFVANTLPHRRMKGLTPTDAIIEVEAADPHHRKSRARAALEIVQRELGAVEIPHDDIWKPSPDAERTHGGEPRYRAYMYIRGRKCVGYLLVERLEEAFAVLNPSTTTAEPSPKDPPPHAKKNKISALAALRARKAALTASLPSTSPSPPQQPLALSTTPSPAVLGISRIWTSATHRGQNIASALLDAAVKYHNDFVVANGKKAVTLSGNPAAEVQALVGPLYEKPAVVRREEVAFSQPTEAGARLAGRWVGRAYGWLVYA
jgi:N-acetyltransferase